MYRRQPPFQRNYDYDFEDTDCKNCFDILLKPNCYDEDTNKMKKSVNYFF